MTNKNTCCEWCEDTCGDDHGCLDIICECHQETELDIATRKMMPALVPAIIEGKFGKETEPKEESSLIPKGNNYDCGEQGCCRPTKPSYHQLLRERFAIEFKEATDEFGLPHAQVLRSRLNSFVIKFIDEVVAETEHEKSQVDMLYAFKAGANDTRAVLIEKIETEKIAGSAPALTEYETGYNQALDDLLTHLRSQ